MNSLRLVATGLAGYALGSIPTARIAAKLSGSAVDVSAGATGNPGAYNTGKLLGRRWGLLVGAGDVGKGLMAGLVGRGLAGDPGCYLAATTAVAGHVYPVGRRGGKGVATSFGSCLAAFPLYAPVDVAVATAALILRRRGPEGSRAAPAVLASTTVFLAVTALWSWRRWPNPGGPRSGPGLFGYALASSLLIVPKWLRP
jgi:glycerol-3-phosphate acyltransferase PlsY